MTGRHTAIRLTSKCFLAKVKISEKKTVTQNREHGIFTHTFLTALRRERNFKWLLPAQVIHTLLLRETSHGIDYTCKNDVRTSLTT